MFDEAEKVFQGPTDKNICPVRAPKKKMLVLDVWRWIGPAPDRWTPGNRWTVDRPLSHFSLFTCLWVASFDWNFTWLNFKCNSIWWARAFSADFQDEKNPQAAGCQNLNLPLSLSTWTLLYLRLKVTDFDLGPLRHQNSLQTIWFLSRKLNLI